MKNKTQLLTRLFALTVFASMNLQKSFSQTLTVGEVHSYKVGDVFAISTAAATGPAEISIEKITGRTDFGTDSVQFIKQVETHYFDYPSKTWKKYQSTKKYTIKGLNNAFFTQFKQKDTLIEKRDSNNNQLISRYRLIDHEYNDSCQTLVNERMDSNWTKISGEICSKVKAYKGLGVLMYYLDKQGSLYVSLLDQSFIYYKSNGVICGDTALHLAGLNPLHHDNAINLWPNPVKDILFNSSRETFDYTIYDCKGQLVMEGTSGPADGIVVSGLSPGIYYLSMENLISKQHSSFLKE